MENNESQEQTNSSMETQVQVLNPNLTESQFLTKEADEFEVLDLQVPDTVYYKNMLPSEKVGRKLSWMTQKIFKSLGVVLEKGVQTVCLFGIVLPIQTITDVIGVLMEEDPENITDSELKNRCERKLMFNAANAMAEKEDSERAQNMAKVDVLQAAIQNKTMGKSEVRKAREVKQNVDQMMSSAFGFMNAQINKKLIQNAEDGKGFQEMSDKMGKEELLAMLKLEMQAMITKIEQEQEEATNLAQIKKLPILAESEIVEAEEVEETEESDSDYK